jgi:hypothetical protein
MKTGNLPLQAGILTETSARVTASVKWTDKAIFALLHHLQLAASGKTQRV